jgi:hypothetical protein
MDALFPDDRPSPPTLPEARWLRTTVTLAPQRRVVAVQVDLISLDGTLLLSHAYYPVPGGSGSLDVVADGLRYAKALTMDAPTE